jgi:hypothetical protein
MSKAFQPYRHVGDCLELTRKSSIDHVKPEWNLGEIMANWQYPWNTWMNGERHTIHRGEDFGKEAAVMAKYIRNHARYHGMKAKVRVHDEESISLTFYKPEGTDAE